MSAVRRTVLLALLAVSALVGGASSASAAITVSNPGTLTMTDSGNVHWDSTFFGFPVTMTCSTANLTGSVSSSGAVSISNATFSSCLDGFGGATAVTANGLPWTAQIKGTTGAYRVDSLNVKLTLNTGFGTCAYNGGTLTTVAAASPMTQLSYSGAGPLTSTTSGCGNMTWTGDYNLSRSLSVSGTL